MHGLHGKHGLHGLHGEHGLHGLNMEHGNNGHEPFFVILFLPILCTFMSPSCLISFKADLLVFKDFNDLMNIIILTLRLKLANKFLNFLLKYIIQNGSTRTFYRENIQSFFDYQIFKVLIHTSILN